MSKKILSFWRLLLGSFITLLGFGSCKTSKSVPPKNEPVVLYGPPPPSVIEKQRPIDEMRLLYGVPPVKVEKLKE